MAYLVALVGLLGLLDLGFLVVVFRRLRMHGELITALYAALPDGAVGAERERDAPGWRRGRRSPPPPASAERSERSERAAGA